MKLILPKSLVHIDLSYGPLFFLAGPIRGGGDWQAQCFSILLERSTRFHAAIPCRWGAEHPLTRHKEKGDEKGFARQLDWERHYLWLAARQGCILFWLPCESKTAPHPGPEPYAMDTRGELGRWSVHLAHDQKLRVVIGAEEGFHGLSQIQRNFSQDVGYDFPIHTTLEATVAAAIGLSGLSL